MRSERTKAAASVGLNVFAEKPATFDPELFDPKESQNTKGMWLRTTRAT